MALLAQAEFWWRDKSFVTSVRSTVVESISTERAAARVTALKPLVEA